LVDAHGKWSRLRAGDYTVSGARLAGRRRAFPVVLVPGSAPLRLDGFRYHGNLTLRDAGSQLEAVNAVPLERYVADVVSVETPGSWDQEALRAQAIACRSYALASLRPRASFDLYANARSQDYRGLRGEIPAAADATSATRAQVLRFRGRVVTAFFTAANGGMTSNTNGIWGGPALPYLRSRPDPFDARGPDRNWGPRRISISALRETFPQIPDPVTRIKTRTNNGHRITAVSFLGKDGSGYRVDGATFQQRLGLRSAYVAITARYARRKLTKSSSRRPLPGVRVTGRVGRRRGALPSSR
jgi:SpoIID/LytB domain protein